MILRKWEDLPEQMQNDVVKPYYDHLRTKRYQILIKRMFDLLASITLLVLLSPVLIAVSVVIVLQSGRPVFFRQKRVTLYGREFRIFKFRTMVADAQTRGPQLTTKDDDRITSIGKRLRDRRLDEIPQLFNILLGDMSFVGTRPEVPRFVELYTPEMLATLLLPAGLTSVASIQFKDENAMYVLHPELDQDTTYVRFILPCKMEHNLKALASFSLMSDAKVLFDTFKSVLLKT